MITRNFTMAQKKQIHLRVRGLLVNAADEILLCQAKGCDWFFLPGGSVEHGETAESALFS